jgi:hypothetical protein
MEIKNTNYDEVHWFTIKVLNHKREVIEYYLWDNLRFKLRIKYDWYFKYRAALLQVKHPRFKVETYWGNEPAIGKTLLQFKKDKIKSKKSKITEYKNKLNLAKQNWISLFPIEDDPFYQKAELKINRLENELKILQNEL